MPKLDASQKKFVGAPVADNIRLLAPAGCGKTFCLLHRCKSIHEQKRARFLIVTFTVAARQELASRLSEEREFASLRDAVEITTLNAWGWRRLREGAASFPRLITSNDQYHFTMRNQLQGVWQKYDAVRESIESGRARNRAPRNLMNLLDAFKSLGFDHTRNTSYEAFSDHIDLLHSHGLTWRVQEQFYELVKLDILDGDLLDSGASISRKVRQTVYKSFFKFWREATEHLISNATFTLEDQKYAAYLDERGKVESRSFLSGAARRDHVLVDEFQDINPLDLALVKAIADRNRATITIAGDDDQAIFEWRGATPDYILDPDEFFGKKFQTHILGINYRSPANIVSRSQRLIVNNKRRVDKEIKSANLSGNARIEVLRPGGLLETLNYVYGLVEEAVATGASPSKVAIIGRKRSQIIPYQVYFASKEVSFCAAEDLQLFLGGAFDRILELLAIKEEAGSRSSRRKSVDNALQLCDLTKRYPLNKIDKESVRSHLINAAPRSLAAAANALAGYRGRLKGANQGGAMSSSMADAIRDFIDADTVSETLTALSENFDGLQFDLGKAEEDIFYVDPPFLQLAEFAESYGDDYGEFIDDIERAQDQLVYIPPYEDNPQAARNRKDDLWKRPVHLMTALRAKGKEFDTVVLLDVLEGIWPNHNNRSERELEQERRVFYVAFTRARKRVAILTGDGTAARSRYISELGMP